LFAQGQREWVQARALSAGQNNAFQQNASYAKKVRGTGL
jgi:hypothetical protein